MEKNLLLKNIIYKFSLNILKIIIPIITFPYIYRIFNPQIIGNIEFSLSISSYFLIFAGFGVYNYGLREISYIRNNKEKKDKIFSELLIISIISTGLTLILYLLYVYLKFNNNILLKNMLLINSINILSYFIYIEWINEAFENYKFISIKTIIIRILNLICILLFIKKINDFYKYLFLLNFFIFLNNFISFIYIKKYVKITFKNLCLKKYFLPLSVLLFISNIDVFYSGLDKILLGFYSNKIEEVAYYSISQRVLSILIVIVMSIISVSMPRLSSYLGENRKSEYERLLNEISLFLYLILFPISIGIMILSKEIILFFGGRSYLSAQILLIVAGIRIIFITIGNLMSNNIIFLKRKEKIMLTILIIIGIINFILKYVLIKVSFFNALNVVITTMLVEIILIILEYFYIKKYLNLKFNIFKVEYVKYLIFSLPFFLIKYLLKDISNNYLIQSIIIFICCLLFYIFLLILFKDKYLINLLKNLKVIKNDRK